MENTEEGEEIKEPALSRYYIDLPPNEHSEKSRLSYGYDPEDAGEHGECPGAGYYVTVIDRITGNTIFSKGISECLTGPELLDIVEKFIPKAIESKEYDEYASRTGDITVGLPI